MRDAVATLPARGPLGHDHGTDHDRRAASDTVASVASHSQPHYDSIPASTEKFLIVFQGDHYLSTNRTSTDNSPPEDATPSYDIQAAYKIPFYKLFLEDDERYRPYLYGDQRSMVGVSRDIKSQM